jgi:hypothetical protein
MSFNSAQQVLWNGTVCAVLQGRQLRPTGRCVLNKFIRQVPEDDGFTIRNRPYIVVTIEAR